MRIKQTSICSASRIIWAKKTFRPEESLWSIVCRIIYLNKINRKEAIKMFGLEVGKTFSVDLLNAQAREKPLNQYLSSGNISSIRKFAINLLGEESGNNSWIPQKNYFDVFERDTIRYCPSCIQNYSYHSVVFQFVPLIFCPYHKEPLISGCYKCGVEIKKQIASQDLNKVFFCKNCKESLVSESILLRSESLPFELTSPLKKIRLWYTKFLNSQLIFPNPTDDLSFDKSVCYRRELNRACCVLGLKVRKDFDIEKTNGIAPTPSFTINLNIDREFKPHSHYGKRLYTNVFNSVFRKNSVLYNTINLDVKSCFFVDAIRNAIQDYFEKDCRIVNSKDVIETWFISDVLEKQPYIYSNILSLIPLEKKIDSNYCFVVVEALSFCCLIYGLLIEFSYLLQVIGQELIFNEINSLITCTAVPSIVFNVKNEKIEVHIFNNQLNTKLVDNRVRLARLEYEKRQKSMKGFFKKHKR